MKIILGVFFRESFEDLKNKFGAQSFSLTWDYERHLEYVTLDSNTDYILSRVLYALDECDECVFDLTHVLFDLNENVFKDVVSLRELHEIIIHPEYLQKTTFYRNGEIVDKQIVIDHYLFNDYWQ